MVHCAHQMAESLATEQMKNLRRVSTRSRPMILGWLADRIAIGRPEFYLVELTSFIGRHYPSAPDTVGRVLRHLNATGQVIYTVKDRSKSLYEIHEVRSAR